MAGTENIPRSLMSEVTPTPMPKSTLPCDFGDPLLRLTPEKQTRPLGASKQGCVRVERHVATDVLTKGRTNVPLIQNKATELGSNTYSQVNQRPNRDKGRTVMHVKETMKSNYSQVNQRQNSDKTRNAMHAKETMKNKVGRKMQKCVRIEEPCKLKEPQCHSTALVGKHLEWVQNEQFHGDVAVLKALEESRTVRTAFAERVADGVNRPIDERKYSGLIAVDVPVEDTIAQATEEKLVKVKGAQGAKKTSKIAEGPVPDILDVFSPDMIVEQPSFDVPSFSSNNIQLEQAPADMAFNLYKHMRCWQST